MKKSWMDSKGVQFMVFAVLAIVILGGVHVYFNPPRAFEPSQTTRTAQIDTALPNATPDQPADPSTRRPYNCQKTYYYDGDHDGYGAGGPLYVCTDTGKAPTTDYATKSGDCDDHNPKIHPDLFANVDSKELNRETVWVMLERICANGVDDDCDGYDESCQERWRCFGESITSDSLPDTHTCHFTSERYLCGDEIDDDEDGKTDCNDPDCFTALECGYQITLDSKGYTFYLRGEYDELIRHGDGTDDHIDDDGDGYCETSPCVSSADPSLKLEELKPGDCQDNPVGEYRILGSEITPRCKHGPHGCIFHTNSDSYDDNPGAVEQTGNETDENCDGILE